LWNIVVPFNHNDLQGKPAGLKAADGSLGVIICFPAILVLL